MMSKTTDNKKWWVLAGVSIASFLGCIDFTIVNTALPAIQSSLSSSMTQLQWIINIFILALSTCMVIMGRLADIYGRRLLLYIGMIGFGLSSLGAGLATHIDILIAFRLIQGMSCAILYTASGAIVSNAFPVNERGKAIGALFGINGVGLAIGPVLGGILVSALTWNWVFLINVPLILISLLICFLNVKESKSEEQNQSIDWLGLTTLTAGLSSLVLSITQGAEWGWLSIPTLALFILSGFMFLLFYYIELESKSPIIELHLFLNRIFIVSVVATAALAFFYCVAFFLMPLYLNLLRGDEGYTIGIMLLPITATVAILSPFVGKIVDKIGPKYPLVCGLTCFIISALMQLFFSGETHLITIMVAFVTMGIGWACILGPSTVAALSSVPESSAAVAMGSSWTLHNIGGALGLALGLVAYHSAAKTSLLTNLALPKTIDESWVDKIISNPENATSLLQQHISQNSVVISHYVQKFFLSGYHHAMGLLVISSAIALLVVMLGMKKKLTAFDEPNH